MSDEATARPLRGVSWNPEFEGGPAFAGGNPTHGGHPGMSLRDYFAGQALAGMVSGGWFPNSEAECAARLYKIADAMIGARDALQSVIAETVPGEKDRL